MTNQPTLFQDLHEDERLALKKRAESGETLTDLWRTLTPTGTAGWSTRAETAAQMLGPVVSVTDIGCGVMTLERFVPGIRYVPLDCVSRDERTVIVDLNHDPLPDCETEAAAVLGLLEYLHDVSSFLSCLRKYYKIAVVSYNVADSSSTDWNASNTWVNRFERAQIEDLFAEFEFEIEQVRSLDEAGRQLIWRLRSTTRD